jgi:beta-glucanase (GH16 family)
VWQDEFDGDELDPQRWSPRGRGRQPGRVGVLSPQASRLTGDGFLVLESSYQDGELLTAMIGTQDTFTAAHGWFEARIRFQRQPGHHGAFWLQAHPALSRGGAARGSEVDIIEYFGDRGTRQDLLQAVYPSGTTNTGTFTAEQGAQFFPLTEMVRTAHETPATDFHTYAVEWTPTGYRFYVDGRLTASTRAGRSDAPAYVVLSLVSSAWENPRLDESRLPDSMTVDYVRVFAPGDAARAAGAWSATIRRSTSLAPAMSPTPDR